MNDWNNGSAGYGRTDSGYLAEAAKLLGKAADQNEKLHGSPRYESTQRALIEGRERIAMKFAQLGAIERGIMPPDMIADVLRSVQAEKVRA